MPMPCRVEQLAQPLHPVDVARQVLAVSAGRAQRDDEAGLLEVAQHPLGPAGGLCRLLDRQRRPRIPGHHR